MAEKTEKRPEAAAPPPAADKKAPAPKAPIYTRTPVVVTLVMVLEGILMFAGFKFLAGHEPSAAQGAQLLEATEGASAHGEGEGEGKGEGKGKSAKPTDKNHPVELKVVEFKAPNKQTGRTFLYDVSIYLVTKGEHEEKAKTTLEQRDALVRDRIRTIIAQSDPEKLGGGSEPGLETLRRQIKYQLDEIMGEGVIDEILIPRCIPYRAE